MNLTGRPVYQKGQRSVVVPALRAASRDQSCTLRIPGVCHGNTATTVGAHLRLFAAAGMGQKPADLFMVDACAACHAALDSRARWAELALGYDDILRALMETQTRRVDAGLIRLGKG
jgi:hypothetical protein